MASARGYGVLLRKWTSMPMRRDKVVARVMRKNMGSQLRETFVLIRNFNLQGPRLTELYTRVNIC